MCLQCDVEAVTVVDDVLPGYKLMVATVGHKNWPVGHFGLVWSDDPDVVLPSPIGDPTINMTEKEIDALPVGSPILKQWFDHGTFVDMAEPSFRTDPMTGYRLIKACMEAGYDPEQDGYRAASWIVNRLAWSLDNAAASEEPQ